MRCDPGEGYSINSTDCDTDETINPNAGEFVMLSTTIVMEQQMMISEELVSDTDNDGIDVYDYI